MILDEADGIRGVRSGTRYILAVNGRSTFKTEVRQAVKLWLRCWLFGLTSEMRLCYQVCVPEPLADATFNHVRQLSQCVLWPVVVPTLELGNVAVKVLWTHLVVDANVTSLEQGPEGLHPVGVGVGHVFHKFANAVLDRFVVAGQADVSGGLERILRDLDAEPLDNPVQGRTLRHKTLGARTGAALPQPLGRHRLHRRRRASG